MKRLIVLLVFMFLLSCSNTTTLPKYSEEVSRNVHATKDSIELARFDLAAEYAELSARLITPPKERIDIQSLHKPSAVLVDENSKSELPSGEKYVVIPSKFKGMSVLVVGSEEYKQLLKIKEYAEQVQKELDIVVVQKHEADQELIKLEQNRQELLKSVTVLNVKLQETKSALLKRNLLLGGIFLAVGIYIALKVRKAISII